MVRLRLRRVGRKNQPSFRIVAASKESPRDGKFLEIVGFYNARTNPETVTFKEDKIYKWLKNGAQPSDSVDRIFKTHGVWDRYERFKAGEELEVLMKEAAEAEEARVVSPKTRFAAPKAKLKKEEPVVEEAPVIEEVVEEASAVETAAVVEEKVEEPVVAEKEEVATEEPAVEAEPVVEEKAVVEEVAEKEEKAEETPKKKPAKKAPAKKPAKKAPAKKPAKKKAKKESDAEETPVETEEEDKTKE